MYLSNGLGLSQIKMLQHHISKWDTTKTSAGSSNNNQIKLPVYNGGSYDFIVDWGDGNQDTITAWNDAVLTHTYASTGIYTITIIGQLEGFRFNNAGDKLKLIEIINGGNDFRFGNSNAYLYGCSNLTSVSNIVTTGMTNGANFFRGCSSLNCTLDFDASSIQNFTSMLQGCTILNSPIKLDTSSGTTMYAMLYECAALNQELNFDTSSVTTMYAMLYGCATFNKALSFDTAKVTSMGYMLAETTAFNQDISGFDIDLVTTMASMLTNSGISDTNYSNALIAWNAGSHQDNVTLNASASYEAGAAAARTDFINNHGWTITDGGAA